MACLEKFILANIDTNIMEQNFHANRGWLDTYEIKKKKEKKIFPKTKRPTERRPPDYPNQDDQIEEVNKNNLLIEIFEVYLVV